jgi:RNA polymerase sigma-70 factor (ECF subfamily)
MEPKEEGRWIAAAQGGDDLAFARLVEHYAKPVHNLCYRMLGDPADAEDAAQETFLKAYQKLKSYDPLRSFPTWLLSIGAHHCIDQLRRRRFKLISLDAVHRRPAGRASQPERQAEHAREQALVQAELAKLRPHERAAIVMHYWYDFSYPEIGAALGLSVSAVKSRMHRARRILAARAETELRAGGREPGSVTTT